MVSLVSVPHSRRRRVLDRSDLLQRLGRVFETRHVAALAGPCGTGKSELAIEYCYQYRDENPGALILWVTMESKAQIEQRFMEFARSLSLPVRNHSATHSVIEYLCDRSERPWLLVMDDFQTRNEKENGQLGEASGSNSSTLIIQNFNALEFNKIEDRSIFSDAMVLLVTPPCTHAAASMLSNIQSEGLNHDQDDRDLAIGLEHSPLAITLAASYMKENGLSSEAYLEAFKLIQTVAEAQSGDPGELNSDKLHTSKAVANAVILSLTLICKDHPLAFEILSRATILDSYRIPTALLFQSDYGVRSFHRAMRKLCSLSLLTPLTLEANYYMNRHVQQLCEIWLRRQDRPRLLALTEEALLMLAKGFGHGDQSFWRSCEIMNPHALKLIESELANPSSLSLGLLLGNMGSYEHRRGNYDVAHQRYTKAIAIYENNKEYGLSHRVTRSLATKDAELLVLQGKITEAEEKITKLRQDMEKALGENVKDDECYMSMGGTLALIYHSQGNYELAEEYFRDALKSNIKAHYDNHVDSLTLKSNLALLLRDRGNYEEAETLFREALEGTKLERELDHPDTLQRMTNLATLFVRQGKYNEAEELTRGALDISERVQGPDHPDTLGMVNNLAIALTQLGRYSEAEVMHRRHVEAKKSTMDSSYVVARMNLAVLLHKMGKIEESAKEYEGALDANEILCGKGNSNPTTLNLWSSLGVIYLKQGTLARAEKEHAKATDKFTQASNMIEKSLRQQRILLGEAHQLTLVTRNNLAGVKQRMGQYAEAKTGFEEVLQLAAEGKMGDDHPLVLRITNNLGELLRESKIDLGHAKDLLNIALAGRERALGASHPDTLTTMYNLAHQMHDGKDFEKAEELYRKALEGLKDRLGLDHSTTRDCDKNFQRLLEEKEKFA